MAFARTIEFRFKLPEISSNTPPSQSLLVNRVGSTNGSTQFGIYLEYTGSLNTGSYVGAPIDPYYQYGTLKFILPSENISSSIYLPFFNGDWWSVMVTNDSYIDPLEEDDDFVKYDFYAVNKTLNKYSNNVVKYEGSSSFTASFDWDVVATTLIPGSGSSTILGKTYVPATGSFQELRYYTVSLSQSQFVDFGMNSNSIEGNTLTASYDTLFFRAALGGELYTGSNSIHPSVDKTASFTNGSSSFSYSGSYTFESNVETHFYDQFLAGIKNPVSKKIKHISTTLPYSGSEEANIPIPTTLSPYRSIQQTVAVSESYTRDLNYVEVAFSPQDEINDDINNQLGYFNVGEFIGDPRLVATKQESYPALNSLRDYYFKKYKNNYNWNDYIRLIKFFDNSLFKMIKDWVPAKTSLASGIVIKQNILERNKYPVPQFTTPRNELLTCSIETGFIEGGNALNLETNQSWSFTVPTVFGPTVVNQTDQIEFYTGIYSGSTLSVTDGILALPTESVIINNAVDIRRNNKYMEVDFSSNQTVAVNQQFILSGSAAKASVPDSNYTMARIINPRYVGVKNDEIDNYVNQFALFDWIGGSDPQYPGGGNIHIINLIDINGNITTLTEQNKNLFTVSNIFKKGDPVYGYQTTPSATFKALPVMNIIEGGALYESILAISGSGTDVTGSIEVINQSFIFDSISYNSATLRTDFVDYPTVVMNDVDDNGWLYWMFSQTSGSFVAGNISIKNGNTYFYSKSGEVFTNNSTIKYTDSLLPIQKGDYIRISSGSAAPLVDGSFEGYQLYQYNNNIVLGGSSATSSFNPLLLSSVVPVSNTLDDVFDSSFRIFRRTPNETFVLIQNIPGYRSRGLLIPYNFNPNFDPVEIARRIGLV